MLSGAWPQPVQCAFTSRRLVPGTFCRQVTLHRGTREVDSLHYKHSQPAANSWYLAAAMWSQQMQDIVRHI